jgi:hypothetical protein
LSTYNKTRTAILVLPNEEGAHSFGTQKITIVGNCGNRRCGKGAVQSARLGLLILPIDGVMVRGVTSACRVNNLCDLDQNLTQNLTKTYEAGGHQESKTVI